SHDPQSLSRRVEEVGGCAPRQPAGALRRRENASHVAMTTPSPRSWSLALLLPAEPGRRNRRTIDGVLVAAAAALAGLEAVVARSARGTDEEAGQAVATLLGWASGVWRAVIVATLALAVLIVAEALV